MQARSGERSRLSPDNKTKGAAKLITAIRRFKNSRTPADSCRMLIHAGRQNTTPAIEVPTL